MNRGQLFVIKHFSFLSSCWSPRLAVIFFTLFPSEHKIPIIPIYDRYLYPGIKDGEKRKRPDSAFFLFYFLLMNIIHFFFLPHLSIIYFSNYYKYSDNLFFNYSWKWKKYEVSGLKMQRLELESRVTSKHRNRFTWSLYYAPVRAEIYSIILRMLTNDVTTRSRPFVRGIQFTSVWPTLVFAYRSFTFVCCITARTNIERIEKIILKYHFLLSIQS